MKYKVTLWEGIEVCQGPDGKLYKKVVPSKREGCLEPSDKGNYPDLKTAKKALQDWVRGSTVIPIPGRT